MNLESLISEGGLTLPSFSIAWLIAGLVFSSIGIYLLRQAKMRANMWWGLIGLGLLFYSYFVTDPVWSWVVGFGLCFLAYVTRYAG
jgi:multisubunit Na+/H+ antiporter MnhE subunit